MKLKPRLAAVAELVPRGDTAADIGTDHGYLPVYLALQRNCPRVVAVEKSTLNMQAAQETVARYRLEDRIEIRQGDGLHGLTEADTVRTVVLAGLGGKTICQLLAAAKDRLFSYRRLCLQPMGDSGMLRRWLVETGFCLVQEKLAREKGRYYEIMAAEPGEQVVEDPFLLELGPVLVRDGDPLLVPWLEKQLHACQEIAQRLRESNLDRSSRRLRHYEKRCRKLKEVLQRVGQRP